MTADQNPTPAETRPTRGWWSRLWTRLAGRRTVPADPTRHDPPTGQPRALPPEPPHLTAPTVDPNPGSGPRSRDAETSWGSQDVLAELTRQGFHVGTAPYGYTVTRWTIVDERGRIRTRSRLVPDPARAEVVRSIFHWRVVGGLDLEQILRRLNTDHRRYPPPPARRPDRPSYWRAKTLAGLLSNPKYTGFQVRNHRDSHGGLRPVVKWVRSESQAHQALVSLEMFWAAQNPTPESVRAWRRRLLAAQGRRPCA